MATKILIPSTATAQAPPPITNSLHVWVDTVDTNQYGVNHDVTVCPTAPIVFFANGTISNTLPNEVSSITYSAYYSNGDSPGNEQSYLYYYWNHFSNCVTTISNIVGGTLSNANGVFYPVYTFSIPTNVTTCEGAGLATYQRMQVWATNLDSVATLQYNTHALQESGFDTHWTDWGNYGGHYAYSLVNVGETLGLAPWWRIKPSSSTNHLIKLLIDYPPK
jgi:hypothetical protein